MNRRREVTAFEFQHALSIEEIASALRGGRRRRVFVEAVHEVNSATAEAVFNEARPRVLCRPAGEGKSTELNLIEFLYTSTGSAPDTRVARMHFEAHWLRRQRCDLSARIATELEVSQRGSFEDLLATARHRRLLLLFDGIENLSQECLVWLVASLHRLSEPGRSFLADRRAFVAAAGSMSLGHVAREITSMFFTEELSDRVQDYSMDHLATASSQMSEIIDMGVDQSGLEFVHGVTLGEKRTANAVLHIASQIQLESEDTAPANLVDRETIEKAYSLYLEQAYRLDMRWASVLRSLCRLPEARAVSREIVGKATVEWSAVPPDLQKQLYNGGMVTVLGGEARPRNTVVRELLARALVRSRRATVFVRQYLPRGDVVARVERLRRRWVARDLQAMAFVGQLLWMYYGEVVEEEESHVLVQLTGDDGEETLVRIGRLSLGFPLRLHQGFVKYAYLHGQAPREDYFLFGQRRRSMESPFEDGGG